MFESAWGERVGNRPKNRRGPVKTARTRGSIHITCSRGGNWRSLVRSRKKKIWGEIFPPRIEDPRKKKGKGGIPNDAFLNINRISNGAEMGQSSKEGVPRDERSKKGVGGCSSRGEWG